MKKIAVASESRPVEEGTKLCACGCRQAVNPKRSFKPGHDAKLKSALLSLWDDGQGAMAEELVTRGWYTWEQLEQRQADRIAKAAKKAGAGTKTNGPDAGAEVKDGALGDVGEVQE